MIARQNYKCGYKKCPYKDHPWLSYVLPRDLEGSHHPAFPAVILAQMKYNKTRVGDLYSAITSASVLYDMRVARSMIIYMHKSCHTTLDKSECPAQRSITNLQNSTAEQKTTFLSKFEDYISFPSYFDATKLDQQGVPLGHTSKDHTDSDEYLVERAVQFVIDEKNVLAALYERGQRRFNTDGFYPKSTSSADGSAIRIETPWIPAATIQEAAQPLLDKLTTTLKGITVPFDNTQGSARVWFKLTRQIDKPPRNSTSYLKHLKKNNTSTTSTDDIAANSTCLTP
jgi:hypothetical protein